MLVNGEYVIVEQVQHEILEAPVATYNFEVQDFHTYYVGESAVLVHNLCGAELSDDALRSFGTKGNTSGFRVTKGTHTDAMNFVKSQTNGLTEYAPGKFVGYNSRGTEFRIYQRVLNDYTSIRIKGVPGLKGIKFLWP